MRFLATTLLVLTVLLVLLPAETYAFGAGDIPDFAYLNGKAFRHGDIENVLAELAKTVGHVSASGGGGLLGIASSVFAAATSGGQGATFTSEDVKRVYFGNWLRDYSQAMDIAGLSKLSADTLVLIVSVLGFLTFGFATEEFQVTADRLGVYLPVEHIDNPKGYAEKEGDARQFHPKLRPPVNPEELEIDERTGMKNYMACENRGWDTSTALIRRVFRGCIEHGRRARGREGNDLWEAYRLMGTGLHTMEDLLAHSNWCELALRKMGHSDVFCHVGDNVLIETPNGQTHPLVTGTFGSADFLHSLMGEATDHLSQASVVDLSKKMDDAAKGDNPLGNLQAILQKLPIGGGDDDKMGQADAMQAQAKAYHFDPDNVAPPEVRQQLWNLLKWRDNIYRDIIKKIEMIPGLSELIDNLTNALNAFVYTVLAPYVTPILKQVTEVLTDGSKAVIDSDDQYQVFDDPDASDPSHSLLSKDHFALILNEPAGKIAQVVVQNTVKLLVQTWFDDNDPDRVIDKILEAFHHPWYATGRSRIQQEMFQCLENWVTSLENPEETMQALSKESVRAGKNKREGSDDDMTNANQIYGGSSQPSSGYGRSSEAAYGDYSEPPRKTYGRSDESEGYYGNSGRRQEEPSYGRQSGYGGSETSYGRSKEYGEHRTDGESQEYGDSYGQRRREEESYSRPSYGEDEPPSRGGYDDEYNAPRREGYGGPRREEYGQEFGGRREGYAGGFGGREGYGEPPRGEYEEPRREEYGGRYGGRDGEPRGYDGREARGYGDEGFRPRAEPQDFGGREGYAPSYAAPSGYGGGEYGREGRQGGYDGEYGGGDYGRPPPPPEDSYGMEGLSLRDGEERRHHGRHGRHHHHDDEY